MTPQAALERYRHLVVVNGDRLHNELSHSMRKLPENVQASLMAQSKLAGQFWLYRDPGKQGYVMEVVYSPEGNDYISAVYRDDAVNASAGEVIRMRENLITALAERVGLSPEAIAVTDHGRGREIGLNEMTSAQLIDMLDEKLGSSIVTHDNGGGNLSLMQRMQRKVFGR